jgi:hypothetical protein
MFFAAFTSRSWTVPQSSQVHSLIPRPAIPLGLEEGRRPHSQQVRRAHSLPAWSEPVSTDLYLRSRFRELAWKLRLRNDEDEPVFLWRGWRSPYAKSPSSYWLSLREFARARLVLQARCTVASLSSLLRKNFGTSTFSPVDNVARSLRPRSMPTLRNRADQLPQGHASLAGDFLEAVPELVFKADAGLVPCNNYRALPNRRFHGFASLIWCFAR